jgi:hypothetical protein
MMRFNWLCGLLLAASLTACVERRVYTSLEDSQQFSQELGSRYEAETVEVHQGTQFKNGAQLEFILITVRNSSLVSLTQESRAAETLAIAKEVYAQFPDTQTADFFEVMVIKETGTVVTVKEEQPYTFTIKQLSD